MKKQAQKSAQGGNLTKLSNNCRGPNKRTGWIVLIVEQDEKVN